MNKKILMAVLACGLSVSAFAQIQYEHSQARIQEATSDFFVRPIVAELKMLKEECQTYGPFNIYPGVAFSEMTMNHVADAKANAAYRAAMEAGADIILGATFNVVNGKTKDKGLDVIVRGYPAKYVNFHSFGEGQKGAEDAKWIEVLLDHERIRVLNKDNETTTKAVTQDNARSK